MAWPALSYARWGATCDTLHANRQIRVIESLRPLVNSLRDRGLTFVRLDELVGLPAYAPAGAGGAVLMESIR